MRRRCSIWSCSRSEHRRHEHGSRPPRIRCSMTRPAASFLIGWLADVRCWPVLNEPAVRSIPVSPLQSNHGARCASPTDQRRARRMVSGDDAEDDRRVLDQVTTLTGRHSRHVVTAACRGGPDSAARIACPPQTAPPGGRVAASPATRGLLPAPAPQPAHFAPVRRLSRGVSEGPRCPTPPSAATTRAEAPRSSTTSNRLITVARLHRTRVELGPLVGVRSEQPLCTP